MNNEKKLDPRLTERREQVSSLRSQVEFHRRELAHLMERLDKQTAAERRIASEARRAALEKEAHEERAKVARERVSALQKANSEVHKERDAAEREYTRQQGIFRQVYERRIEAQEASEKLGAVLLAVNEERSRYRAEHKRNVARCALLERELAQLQEDVAALEERLRFVIARSRGRKKM